MRPITELLDALSDHDDAAAMAALRIHDDLLSLQGVDAGRAAAVLVDGGAVGDLAVAAELAGRAQSSGVPGAGTTLARSADRLSVMQTRRQRFGTFAYEHGGELHLAPLDGTVTDDMRATMGLAPLSTLRAEVEEANRARARDRAQQPGLSGAPYARVWRDPTEAQLRARWAEVGEPVWADGDELTFVCDRPLAGAVVGPLFELPMWRVGPLLVLQVRVSRLDEVVLTYGFWPLSADGAPAFSHRPDPDGRWRGPAAPPAAPTNEQLVGTMDNVAVPSDFLGSPRLVTVYRPPGHDREEPLPVVYGTDGQFFAPYARRLDAAIQAGTMPRCVVVASHAGPNRTGEYFPGFDPPSFDRHQRFFVDELARWARSTLGVSVERADTAVFGCSDGGAHALAVGLVHHDRFGHVIAYSSGMPPNGDERWPSGSAPFVQLCAGVLEGQFHLATAAWAYYLGRIGVYHHWTERVCGHELIQWIEELPGAVGRAFGDPA